MKPIFFLLAAGAILLAACNKDDNQGKLTLTTDWSKRTEGIAIPSSYTVRVGELSATLSGPTNPYPHLVDPGTYTLYLHNTADKIAVSGTLATVETNRGLVAPLPDWFFTAKTTATITADRTHNITVAIKQQVCQLNLELTLTQGDPARIAKVEGTLAGVATAWNFDTDSPEGEAASVAPAFVRSANKLTASMRLLGLVPTTPHELTLVVTFSNNAQQTITKDLSSLLTGFNIDKHHIRTITADLEIPIETDFSCTIKHWELGKTIPTTAE